MGAENDDYNKASIYSILYGLYANAGEVICGGSACGGVPYQFTFNTWGIAGPTLLEGAPNAARRAAFVGHAVKTLSHVGLTEGSAEMAISLLAQQ